MASETERRTRKFQNQEEEKARERKETLRAGRVGESERNKSFYKKHLSDLLKRGLMCTSREP